MEAKTCCSERVHLRANMVGTYETPVKQSEEYKDSFVAAMRRDCSAGEQPGRLCCCLVVVVFECLPSDLTSGEREVEEVDTIQSERRPGVRQQVASRDTREDSMFAERMAELDVRLEQQVRRRTCFVLGWVPGLGPGELVNNVMLWKEQKEAWERNARSLEVAPWLMVQRQGPPASIVMLQEGQ